MRAIELLSPARNAECGIEAIRCGADAVYIGAQAFNARAEATNSVEDIKRLTDFAHLYGAKVYVAFNTILYEDELEDARRLVEALANVGIDALITQDMALIQMNLPLPLHASTQMDNRTPEQIQFLKDCGFTRVILARELGITDIASIHKKNPDVELEVFVHGALCVSYSGRCYASQYCFGRSANRGECAQFCRLPFDMEDADGNKIIENQHLLSLKDMNRSKYLEELIDAGVSSFKIEGRLKDITYVKNITSYYRQKIDEILQHRNDCTRLSFGRSDIPFKPDPQKTFNRGFTDYFLHGRTKDIFFFNTPKALGEPVGEVKDIYDKSIRVTGVASFTNGDGLCFFDKQKKLQGFRVNRVQNNMLFPNIMPEGLTRHTTLYRNHDEAFLKELLKNDIKRTIDVDILLTETENGFRLSMTDEMGLSAEQHFEIPKTPARTPQDQRQKEELSKLGGTIFSVRKIDIQCSAEYFIPASLLSDWRRQVVLQLHQCHTALSRNASAPIQGKTTVYPLGELDYSYNISNSQAKAFYLEHGANGVSPAFEIAPPENALIMTCKHCLRYALGICKKETAPHNDPLTEPLYLRLNDGKRFKLKFDCHNCQMLIYAIH